MLSNFYHTLCTDKKFKKKIPKICQIIYSYVKFCQWLLHFKNTFFSWKIPTIKLILSPPETTPEVRPPPRSRMLFQSKLLEESCLFVYVLHRSGFIFSLSGKYSRPKSNWRAEVKHVLASGRHSNLMARTFPSWARNGLFCFPRRRMFTNTARSIFLPVVIILEGAFQRYQWCEIWMIFCSWSVFFFS